MYICIICGCEEIGKRNLCFCEVRVITAGKIDSSLWTVPAGVNRQHPDRPNIQDTCLPSHVCI